MEKSNYEVREDEERLKKEEEIIQLLVTAGYFRARIKGLSSFDKVIGGMTWCIQGSRFDIDIDLLYNENANIGKKIALTEKIVRVLKRMKCPHQIEPHQIQGSDYARVYPVVQWLVKHALENREERIAELQRFAQFQFAQQAYMLDSVTQHTAQHGGRSGGADQLLDFLDYMKEANKPRRIFKKPASIHQSEDRDLHANSTLLEYGFSRNIPLQLEQQQQQKQQKQREEEDGDPASLASSAAAARRRSQRDGGISTPEDASGAAQIDENLAQIQQQMLSDSKQGKQLGATVLRGFMGINSNEIRDAVAQYNEQTLNLKALPKKQSKESLQKQIETIQSQLENLTARNQMIESELIEEQKKSVELENLIGNEREKLTETAAKIAHLTQNDDEKTQLNELQGLAEEHETLKKREKELKLALKEEKLKEEETLQKEKQEKIASLESVLNKEQDLLKKARIRLANKTRDEKLVERKLDDIPTKREIQQYQKRFMELYEQIEISFKEHKQLVDLYNSEEATRETIQREVNLLNSIYENYEQFYNVAEGRKQLLAQMEEIVGQIDNLKEKAIHQRDATCMEKNLAQKKYQNLVEVGRQYSQKVKELQDNMKKYENLSSRAAELGISL